VAQADVGTYMGSHSPARRWATMAAWLPSSQVFREGGGTQADIGPYMGSHTPVRSCGGTTTITAANLQSHFTMAMDDKDNNKLGAMFRVLADKQSSCRT
jgi:hypothetical protein